MATVVGELGFDLRVDGAVRSGERLGFGVEPGLAAPSTLKSNSIRRIYLGEWVDVPVYKLDALTLGEEIKGPAPYSSPRRRPCWCGKGSTST